MKKLLKVFVVLAAIIAAGVYYYVTIPAVNIHSAGFWFFLIGALAGVAAVVALKDCKNKNRDYRTWTEQIDEGAARSDYRCCCSIFGRKLIIFRNY